MDGEPPIYARTPWVAFEGFVILIPSSTQDGNLLRSFIDFGAIFR
jgi:hypothetical protein